MTRLQAAIEELRAAMGTRPWVLVLDPCDPTAESWGYALEHSGHPAYVRLGLLAMADASTRYKTLAGGKAGTPISARGSRRHDFDESGACRRCGIDVTLGDTEKPCRPPDDGDSAP